MTTKYLLNPSSLKHSAALRQVKRQARCIGALAFQYAKNCSSSEIEINENASPSPVSQPVRASLSQNLRQTTRANSNHGRHVAVTRRFSTNAMRSDASTHQPGALDLNFFVSSPETAFGATHAAEWLGCNAHEFATGHEYFSARNTEHSVFSIDAEDLIKSPETAFGYVHSSELLPSSATEGSVFETINNTVNEAHRYPSALDIDFLVDCPESAFGVVHSAEVVSEEMKADMMASHGIQYEHRENTSLYEEFLDNLALMASPETAAGVVSTAGLLDDELQGVLARIRGQVNELPHTLEEAMSDSRPIVITALERPFDIVNVNEAWVGLCGYDREEAVNHSLGELLQGPDTERVVAESIIPQLMREHFANVILTNYTKEGRKFRNKIQAGLISDESGRAKYFVGVLEELYDQEGGKYAVH